MSDDTTNLRRLGSSLSDEAGSSRPAPLEGDVFLGVIVGTTTPPTHPDSFHVAAPIRFFGAEAEGVALKISGTIDRVPVLILGDPLPPGNYVIAELVAGHWVYRNPKTPGDTGPPPCPPGGRVCVRARVRNPSGAPVPGVVVHLPIVYFSETAFIDGPTDSSGMICKDTDGMPHTYRGTATFCAGGVTVPILFVGCDGIVDVYVCQSTVTITFTDDDGGAVDAASCLPDPAHDPPVRDGEISGNVLTYTRCELSSTPDFFAGQGNRFAWSYFCAYWPPCDFVDRVDYCQPAAETHVVYAKSKYNLLKDCPCGGSYVIPRTIRALFSDSGTFGTDDGVSLDLHWLGDWDGNPYASIPAAGYVDMTYESPCHPNGFYGQCWYSVACTDHAGNPRTVYVPDGPRYPTSAVARVIFRWDGSRITVHAEYINFYQNCPDGPDVRPTCQVMAYRHALGPFGPVHCSATDGGCTYPTLVYPFEYSSFSHDSGVAVDFCRNPFTVPIGSEPGCPTLSVPFPPDKPITCTVHVR